MPACLKPNQARQVSFPLEFALRGASFCFCLLALASGLYAQVTFQGIQTTLASGFNYPEFIAVDRWGNLYVADTDNEAIKEILAVNGSIPGNPTIVTLASGLSSPSGVAVDKNGNVYFCGYANSTVNEILAVNGIIPTNPTILQLGSGFDAPDAIAVDGSGNVFVADYLNDAVKEILAVNGSIPASNPTINILGSGFVEPSGVAVDGSGNVYVAARFNTTITEIVAVNGTIPASNPTMLQLGSGFSAPESVAVDAHGNIFVADYSNSAVKEIVAADSSVRTLGSSFDSPWGVAVDLSGNVFVSDFEAFKVVEIALGSINIGSQPIGPAGVGATLQFSIGAGTTVGSIAVTTSGSPSLDFTNSAGSSCFPGLYNIDSICQVIAGFSPKAAGLREGAVQFFSGPNSTGTLLASVPIYGNGTGAQLAYGPGVATAIAPTVNGLALSRPGATAVDGAGDLFILDTYNDRIVEVPANGGSASFLYPKVNGQPLSYPQGFGVDGAGDIYIVDGDNGRIVEVPAAGGPATAFVPSGSTDFFGPAIDGAGSLYFGDIGTQRVLEFPAGGGSPIAISPIVNGVPLGDPTGVAVDAAGDLFISDDNNARVIELPGGGGSPISFSPTVNGLVFANPYGLAVDAAGNLFVTEGSNNLLIEIPADGTPAIDLSPTVNGLGLNAPTDVTLDSSGDLFVADTGNNRVIELQRSKAPSLAFPTATRVGTTDTTDGAYTVQIVNIGNQNLDFTGVSYPADFSASSADLNPCTATSSLVAGQSCDLPIEFTPQHAGAPLQETVELTDNALNVPGAMQSISVSGTGTSPAPAALTSPTPDSTLTASSATFTWSTGTGASEYELWVGTENVGSSNLNHPGLTTGNTETVSGLPTNGETLYVRLYSKIAGVWQSKDYTYTAFSTGGLAVLTSPTTGTALTGSSAAFTWKAGTGTTEFELWVGSTGVGSSNIHYPGLTTGTAETVTGLPTNGETLYVRLWSKIAGVWHSNDYTYTAETLGALTTPAPGNTLSSTSVEFIWKAGVGATEYEFWVGNEGVGSTNLNYPGLTKGTTETVSDLPASGGDTVYVRLYSKINGVWQYNDYTYKAE